MSETAAVEFDEDGLVPVVAQDADGGEILMLAYADREAVEATLRTGRAHYRSRSRDELWEKGATSGHVQAVREVRLDCDGDAVVYVVEQAGGACHTGFRSCFHRRVEGVVGDGDAGSADGSGDARAGGDSDGSADGSGDGTAGDALRLTVETAGEEVFDPDAVYDRG